MTSERFPDIEIYLLKAEANEIFDWLGTQFSKVEEQKSNSKSVQWLVDGNEVLFTLNSNKNFASLWFKVNSTPWNNDLECGRVLHAALGKEVRCSKAAWQEGDEGPAWTKLIHGEEKDFDWDK
jgi:hypothetical protein